MVIIKIHGDGSQMAISACKRGSFNDCGGCSALVTGSRDRAKSGEPITSGVLALGGLLKEAAAFPFSASDLSR